jgi:alpha-glucoside transport system permease protein
MFPLVVGGLFLAFAVFTVLRGTIINNLWWVAVVTGLSTSLGLAVAVLADRARGERFAKSIIFMPMAISLVGASVIWRFMYVARDSSKEQTGVMNALWVGLGRLSTGSGFWTWLVGIVLTIAFVGLVALMGQALVRREWGKAVVPGVAALLLGWFLVRYFAIIGGGIGGQRSGPDGEFVANPVNFVQEPPYNNFWLMVVLIWIQTGFSMVILSAAIKAVPTEFIEAARVDGATDSQIFWRVTLPQIAPTIGVVVTTLIVLVMKVYDIVKVMTNGNFGTQVLANDMFQQAFQFGNVGRGASLAVLIFISVLPVMIYNIRKMQREA